MTVTCFRTALCAAALSLPALASAQITGTTPVSEAELRADIAVLASDDYGGRYPGTEGETLATSYIARQLAAAGFEPAAGGDLGWYQRVPLVELIPGSGHARFTAASGRPVPVEEVMVRAPSGTAQIADAPIIFVGHGVDADGHVRADVRGKVAMVLLADWPGQSPLAYAARRDALVAAGARGVLVVPGAQVPFAALQRGYTSSRPQLASRISRSEVEGILSATAADALLRAGGVNPARARAAAEQADYAGQPLRVTAHLFASTGRRSYDSYNVIARLPGTHPDAGAVVMTGHWDHLGTCRPEGEADRICNGAVDNASGIAVLLAAARRLGAGPRPDRDIVIVATTAEEAGLLGAYHFAEAPPLPLASIAIALNVDTVAIAPRGAPMAMVGRGTTPLDAEVDAVARALGRAIDSDEEANAFIRRQDGYALTAAGVPSVMAGGSFTDMHPLQAYLGTLYHGPDDELTDATPLGGAADDADLHVALARHFASLADHPALTR